MTYSCINCDSKIPEKAIRPYSPTEQQAWKEKATIFVTTTDYPRTGKTVVCLECGTRTVFT